MTLSAVYRYSLSYYKDSASPRILLNWLKEGWHDLKDLALAEVSLESLNVEAQISQFAGQDYKKAIASYD
ncbi:hypothetical protein [Nostoc sp. FACHB-888]|uniref:hypothetical protein n=1 Tax=Nostoc sp. FACHB-888 TaxID=2692842 RepID=UPI001683870C|nr:hypothetical protein [Nostoc sp. FACHB-888]MBD2243410.1 hypothetical protein [Nostoc sp. FACHB-888]